MSHTQGTAGGGCVRLATGLIVPLMSFIAAASTRMAVSAMMFILPCVPLCILISLPLASTVTQGRSAVMGVKIIYKKAIKMIIPVFKVSQRNTTWRCTYED